MRKPILIIEPSSYESGECRKACFRKNVSCFITSTVTNALLTLTNQGSNFSAVVIEIYLPLEFFTSVKLANGLLLAHKCLELGIPFLLINEPISGDSSFIMPIVKLMESHQDYKQKRIPVLLGSKNWDAIFDEAIKL